MVNMISNNAHYEKKKGDKWVLAPTYPPEIIRSCPSIGQTYHPWSSHILIGV